MILAFYGAVFAFLVSIYYTIQSFRLDLKWLSLVFLALDVKVGGIAVIIYSFTNYVPEDVIHILQSGALNIPLVLLMLVGTILTLVRIRHQL